MEKSLKEKHQGHQGLRDQLLDLGHPTMKILYHQALMMRGMMEMRIHQPSLVLNFYVMQGSLMISYSLLIGLD
jgi:hypothetical protein